MADHVHRGGSDDRGIPETLVLSSQDDQVAPLGATGLQNLSPCVSPADHFLNLAAGTNSPGNPATKPFSLTFFRIPPRRFDHGQDPQFRRKSLCKGRGVVSFSKFDPLNGITYLLKR